MAFVIPGEGGTLASCGAVKRIVLLGVSQGMPHRRDPADYLVGCFVDRLQDRPLARSKSASEFLMEIVIVFQVPVANTPTALKSNAKKRRLLIAIALAPEASMRAS